MKRSGNVLKDAPSSPQKKESTTCDKRPSKNTPRICLQFKSIQIFMIIYHHTEQVIFEIRLQTSDRVNMLLWPFVASKTRKDDTKTLKKTFDPS